MNASPSVPALNDADLRALVPDADRLKRGLDIFNRRGVRVPSRFRSKLFADVKGSEPKPYRVSVEVGGDPLSIAAGCTCKDAESSPVCKHAAAVLVAWSRAPGSFAVSDAAPEGGTIKVKEGKTTAADVMKAGVLQVDTLLRELAASGVAAAGSDRIEQIRSLGDSFREGGLERLAGLTMDFAHLLDAYNSGRGGMVSTRYADLVTDMRLTAGKLEKYIAGQPLEDRYVEELIGRAFKDSDAAPAPGLSLVEVAFSTRRTTDDFTVRESRFVDSLTGEHYREEQVVRTSSDPSAKRKVSYAGSALVGVTGGVFPGFPPRRLRLIKPGEKAPLGEDVVRALLALAHADVAAALAAFQVHRRDLLAPDLFPVMVRVSSLFARGPRLVAVDASGGALYLCDEPRVEEQIGEALHDGRLCALIGDIGLDAAIPTLWPLASIIEGPFGVELRTIHDEPSPSKRRRSGPSLRTPERETSLWHVVARAAGVSATAIAVGELREEIADCLVAGLAGMSSRVMGSIVPRLSDLGFDRPAAALKAAARLPDPADRMEGVIKVYHALGALLVRLSGAARVDLKSLAPVPGYESLYVAEAAKDIAPPAIEATRARGAINRYEAVLHYARYFESLSPEAIQDNTYPAWADGSVGPYVARSFASRGRAALEAAERVLSEPHGRTAKITAIGVLGAAAEESAEEALVRLVESELDPTLRSLAEDALELSEIRAGRRSLEVGERRRAAARDKLARSVDRLLREPQKEKRAAAVGELIELGSRGAIRALRQAFVGDAAQEVRDKAAFALARLGDAYMVEAFVRIVSARKDPHAITEEIDVAASALGLLGDVRGVGELIAAYAEGYSPVVIADALRGFGVAVTDPFLDVIEARPELAKRRVVQTVLSELPAPRLGDSLVRRVWASREALSADPAALRERADLYLSLGYVQARSRKMVAKAICEAIDPSADEPTRALVKLAQKALGIF